MNFIQLRDSEPGSLDDTVSYWRTEAERLGHVEERAHRIVEVMSSGEWDGFGYEAAIATMNEYRSQLATSRAEAMSIAEIIAEAQRQAAVAKSALATVLSEIDGSDRFVVTDDGVVVPRGADEMTALLLTVEFAAWQRDCESTAADLTDRIAAAVVLATTADETAAAALRQTISPATGHPGG